MAPKSETILVTGGAGYIGSHAVLALLDAGWRVVVLDDLSTGSRAVVPDEATFIEGNVGDARLVDQVIGDHACAGVMHFAGSIVVPESVADPLKYYRNNTCNSRTLIEACVTRGVGRFIFSSTAAVYGEPNEASVDERASTQPINPYGWSKLMTEWMLRDTALATDLRYVAFRYFNVAGADPEGRAGQTTPNATHLIKVACEVAAGQRDGLTIFGTDYPTPDGTCVRDYIHVSDLAAAHVAGLRHLTSGGPSVTLNCGYGRGYSVRQVLDACSRIAGARLNAAEGARRPGDPPALIADARRIGDVLAWKPKLDDLDAIIGTALSWERRLPATRQAKRI